MAIYKMIIINCKMSDFVSYQTLVFIALSNKKSNSNMSHSFQDIKSLVIQCNAKTGNFKVCLSAFNSDFDLIYFKNCKG